MSLNMETIYHIGSVEKKRNLYIKIRKQKKFADERSYIQLFTGVKSVDDRLNRLFLCSRQIRPAVE